MRYHRHKQPELKETFPAENLSTTSYFCLIFTSLSLFILYLGNKPRNFQCQIQNSVDKPIDGLNETRIPRFQIGDLKPHTYKHFIFVRYGIQFSVFSFEFSCVKYSYDFLFFSRFSDVCDVTRFVRSFIYTEACVYSSVCSRFMAKNIIKPNVIRKKD